MSRRSVLVAVVALGLTAALWGATQRRRQQRLQSRSAPVIQAMGAGPGALVAQISLGLKDGQAAPWDGEIAASSGKIVRVAGAIAGEAAIEGTRWKLGSRSVGAGNAAVVQPVVLLAEIDAPPDARIEVRTPRGSFGFAAGELHLGRRVLYLEGQAAVERVPPVAQITSEPGEEDFPACAAAPDGSLWCAWVAYTGGTPLQTVDINKGKFESMVTRGHGDQIRLARFDGHGWTAPLDVTGPALELWRPSVAVDSAGRVHVVWSERQGGDWEVWARGYDPKAERWSGAERVTSESGPDVNVAAAATRSGEVWVAWQRWAGDRFAVVAQPLGAGKKGRRVRPPTAGNEWHAAIAADSAGKVYVAFDSYAAGNYDTQLWILDGGGPGRTVPIAASSRFEARPSVAVDPSDRVWIAYEEAAANWAKDYGSRWEGASGVPFYLDRRIAVRCYASGTLQEPRGAIESEEIQTTYPPSRRKRQSYPRIAFDGHGRAWVLFRRHALATGAGERWVTYAACYEGDGWSSPFLLAASENTLDARPAAARLPGGALAVVYPGDGRTAGHASGTGNNLFLAALESDAKPKEPALAAARQPAEGLESSPVHPRETEEIARIRGYRARVGSKSYQLLRGEFHRHTELTSHRDQDGPFEEIWRYGLDVARMDWIGPGDHDNGGREYTWWLTQKQVDMYHSPPVFLPMFTYERSVVYPSGHRNVMFAQRGIRPLPRIAPPAQKELLFGTPDGGSPDIKNLYAYLRHFDGICSSHTSATNMGTDWRDNDPRLEPVVEIYQGHRQSYEEPKAPKAARDAADSIGGYEPAGYVWNAFARGYKLGFQVSSDHVSTHISYAIVYAERPTREAIVDAFKRRHSYGANDNIILDVRSGENMMGDQFTSGTPPRLEIVVEGTAKVARVDVVRQIEREKPEYVYSTEPNTDRVRLTWTDAAARAGAEHMYYVRIAQQGGAMAWGSPMWIRYAPESR